MLKKLFLNLWILTAMIGNAAALDFNKKSEQINFTVTPEYKTLSKEIKNFSIIGTIDILPDWHIYWVNPGDTGDATILNYFESQQYSVNNTTQSIPQKAVFNDIITTYVYKQKAYFKTEFNLNENLAENNLPFHLVLSYTVCKKECLPQKITMNFTLPIADTAERNPQYIKQEIAADNTFPLPLKTSAQFNQNSLRLNIPKHALKDCPTPEFISYYDKKSPLSDLPKTVVASPTVLDISFDAREHPADEKGILLCDKFAYEITPPNTTSQPLNSPAKSQSHNLVYYLLTALLAGLILNLMPCVLPILSLKALYLAAHKEKASPLSAMIYLAGVLSSFIVLSAMLFYFKSFGTEMGWGFQLQSPAFNIFLMLLFFIIFLNLIDKVPLPDSFADKLSKITANSSFLTGFFAVIIACPCTGPFMGAALGYAVLQPPLIYFGIFLSLGLGYALPYVLIEAFPAFFLKFIPKPGHWMITLKRILSIPIALTCLWLFWIVFHQLAPKPHQDILWEEYSANKITAALENNEPVFIDFTAKWCLVCLLNDKSTLASKDFEKLTKEHHLRLFKADWTNHSPEIASALKSYGRNGIPLYVYYKQGSANPIYLPQILTLDILKETLK